jgi:hypothetical protein
LYIGLFAVVVLIGILDCCIAVAIIMIRKKKWRWSIFPRSDEARQKTENQTA